MESGVLEGAIEADLTSVAATATIDTLAIYGAGGQAGGCGNDFERNVVSQFTSEVRRDDEEVGLVTLVLHSYDLLGIPNYGLALKHVESLYLHFVRHEGVDYVLACLCHDSDAPIFDDHVEIVVDKVAARNSCEKCNLLRQRQNEQGVHLFIANFD